MECKEEIVDVGFMFKGGSATDYVIFDDFMLEEIAIAEGSLSKKAEFMTKYCCIKQNSSLAWLDTKTVENACGEHLDLNDFRDTYCVGGIDLSQTRDLTACAAVIEKAGELYVFAHSFRQSGLTKQRRGMECHTRYLLSVASSHFPVTTSLIITIASTGLSGLWKNIRSFRCRLDMTGILHSIWCSRWSNTVSTWMMSSRGRTYILCCRKARASLRMGKYTSETTIS